MFSGSGAREMTTGEAEVEDRSTSAWWLAGSELWGVLFIVWQPFAWWRLVAGVIYIVAATTGLIRLAWRRRRARFRDGGVGASELDRKSPRQSSLTSAVREMPSRARTSK